MPLCFINIHFIEISLLQNKYLPILTQNKILSKFKRKIPPLCYATF